MEVREPKMSLGYQRGNTWVPDEAYRAWTEDETYKALLPACRHAGISFICEFSYTARRYTAEIETMSEIGERWYITKHNNAYSPHPMEALTSAIRGYDHGSILLDVLCVEMDCKVIKQKLLPLRRLEDAMQALTDTIIVGLIGK